MKEKVAGEKVKIYPEKLHMITAYISWQMGILATVSLFFLNV